MPYLTELRHSACPKIDSISLNMGDVGLKIESRANIMEIQMRNEINDLDERIQQVLKLADEKFAKSNETDRLLLNLMVETIRWTQQTFADYANKSNNNLRVVLERLEKIEQHLSG